MIPAGSTLSRAVIDDGQLPSLTYRLDLASGRVLGHVDGLEAVRQAVLKILLTERFEHFIYSTDYGAELKKLSSLEFALLQSELKRRITEALIQDDRITEVTGFQITASGDEALVAFTVNTDYGDFSTEVRQRV